MIYSMTAFTSQDIPIEGANVRWELRSVNHRYLEMSFKLPDFLRNLEYALREVIRCEISRGKIECVLKLDWFEEKSVELAVDFQRVDALSKACERIKTHSPSIVTQALSPFDFLRWPSIVREVEKDTTEVVHFIQQSFSVALHDLIEAKAREGSKLEAFIQERLKKMHDSVISISARLPDIQKNIRAKLQDKLQTLSVEMDTNRFEQEVLYLIQKMDVSEELSRLMIHLTEIERILKTDKVVGRRLDFLMQELNRETNTLASKVNDTQTIQDSVELKVLIEEMREQIQNLE